jgi:magnesium chelatase subunit I
MPFPFMALVGQVEMRTALLLAVINPNVGGVLLVGPRGIGKTTAARGLSDLLPFVPHSTCINGYGCMPEDYEVAGRAGVCEHCAERLEADQPITRLAPVRLLELPLNARLEDVVGGVNERIAMQSNMIRLDKGLLARADQNILYIDEVNLLSDEIIDSILDAAAQGHFTVRRGPLRATYRSRLALIGSMNPEEGYLRPQILDRFGLRVIVTGTLSAEERAQVYERVRQYRAFPRTFVQSYEEETLMAAEDVTYAREILPEVTLDPRAQALGMELIQGLKIHSHRTEFTLYEAARAYAAADARMIVTLEDIEAVASMALRMRRSPFIDSFIEKQQGEDEEISALLREVKSGKE